MASTHFTTGTTITSEWLNDVNDAVYEGNITAEGVQYTPPFTGGVTETVEAKLAETVSVKDFGAVGDGVTDDTAAIQAAIDATYTSGGGQIFFPVGDYKTSSTIYMKRDVSLIGPDQKLSAAQMYESNTEALILGIARIRPTAAVSTAAMAYDFSLADRLERPYGATINNLVIDSRNQSAGDCMTLLPTPAGEGPFDTGFANGAVRMNNVYFLRAPRYGVSILSTDTEKVNGWFVNCRIAFNGSHGLYAYKSFDVQLDHCFSFANQGDGINLELCATERVLYCDIFSNDGNGITADGYNGRYVGGFSQINGKHGMEIKASSSTLTNKKYRIIDFQFDGNSRLPTGTYSHIFIGSRGGVGCGNVHILACNFGDTPSGGVNRVKHVVELDALPTQFGNAMTDCIVAANDTTPGNAVFNDFFWQSTNFENNTAPDGNQIAQKFYPIPAATGNFAPNTIKGVQYYKTQNVAAATINDITNQAIYRENRDVWILIDDVNTSVKFTYTNLKGNGGVDLAAPCQGKLIHFKNLGSATWVASVYG